MNQLFFLRRCFFLLIVVLLKSAFGGCGMKQPSTDPQQPVTPPAAPIVAASLGPTLVIKAAAPGLSAEEIAELIAAPVEKEFQSLETVPLVETICVDSQAIFLLHTQPGSDMSQLGMLVRDRLAAAKKDLPQNFDETKLLLQSKSEPLFIVTLTSPDGKYDALSLGNYVEQELRSQFSSLPNITAVSVAGTKEAGDTVIVNGQPGIALLLAPYADKNPAEVTAAVQKQLDEIHAKLPEGMSLNLTINATDAEPNETHLIVDVQLPETPSRERKIETLRMLVRLLQDQQEVKPLVGFSRNPWELDGLHSCLLLKLESARNDAANHRAAVQSVCDSIPGMRVQPKSFGKSDPTLIRVAISGPDEKSVDDLGAKLGELFRHSGQYFAYALRRPIATTPRVLITLDRDKLAVLGISSADVAVSLSEKNADLGKAMAAGETISWPGENYISSATEFTRTTIKSAAGHEVPLRNVATMESKFTKLVVYRVNNQPAILLEVQTLGEATGNASTKEIEVQFTAARDALKLGDEYKLTLVE